MHPSRCPLSVDGDSSINPVSRPRRFSMLGAHSSATSFHHASSIHGDCRSTSTPLATFTASAGVSGTIDDASHRCLSSTFAAGMPMASSPPSAFAEDVDPAIPRSLLAFSGVGGQSTVDATMSAVSAVSFTEQEIVRLRDLLTAFESSLWDASSSTSSVEPLTEHDITRLRGLLVAFSDSSPTGSAGSDIDSSGIMRPPSTQAGTSPWILDTGASFHMTHDSSTLSSLRSLDSPVHVRTADGT